MEFITYALKNIFFDAHFTFFSFQGLDNKDELKRS